MGHDHAFKRNRANQNYVDGSLERFENDANLYKEVVDKYTGDNG